MGVARDEVVVVRLDGRRALVSELAGRGRIVRGLEETAAYP